MKGFKMADALRAQEAALIASINKLGSELGGYDSLCNEQMQQMEEELAEVRKKLKSYEEKPNA